MFKKYSIAFLITLLVILATGYSPSAAKNVFVADFPANPIDKPGWKLYFSDEFDGPTLDTSKWLDHHLPHWTEDYNTTQALYSFETLNSSDCLVMRIDENNAPSGSCAIQSFEKDYLHPWKNGLTNYHRDAFDNGYNTMYGYYEIRMKMPDTGGGGHVAWWMVGCQDDTNDEFSAQSAEIDIAEILYSSTSSYSANLHGWKDTNVKSESKKITSASDFSNEFHVFGFEWKKDCMKFYIDNELKAQINQSPNYRMATILSMYVGGDGNWSGVDNHVYPKKWYIDYFRIYKEANYINIAPLAVTSASNNNTEAHLLTDGDTGTGWMSTDNPAFPIYYDLAWDSEQTFDQVKVYSRNYCRGQGPENWDIQVSNDNVNWITVASSGDVSWESNDSTTLESKTVAFSPVTARYMRLKMNSAHLTWNHFLVYDIQVMNSENEISPSNNIALIASASASANNKDVHLLNDGNVDTGWISKDNPALPNYLKLTWDLPQTFHKVTVYAKNYCQEQGPKNWDVQISDDNINWTTVALSGDVTWTSNDSTTVESKELTFAPITAKYMRLKMNSANLVWKHFMVYDIQVE